MITDADIIKAANDMGLEPARVKAIWLIESNGSGYYTRGKFKGKVLVRLEGHKFNSYTEGKYLRSHPHLANISWRDSSKHNRRLEEYGRYKEACEVNAWAAKMSTSFGASQVLGSNYRALGYKTVGAMVKDFEDRPASHLEGLLSFCKNNRLLRGLKYNATLSDLKRLLRGYNGSSYIRNGYLRKWDKVYPTTKYLNE